MTAYDYHTADGAEVPHVAVFTVDSFGAEAHRVANFYPLPGEPLAVAEDRAIAFLAVLRRDALLTLLDEPAVEENMLITEQLAAIREAVENGDDDEALRCIDIAVRDASPVIP
jgi:hypothetical protein